MDSQILPAAGGASIAPIVASPAAISAHASDASQAAAAPAAVQPVASAAGAKRRRADPSSEIYSFANILSQVPIGRRFRMRMKEYQRRNPDLSDSDVDQAVEISSSDDEEIRQMKPPPRPRKREIPTNGRCGQPCCVDIHFHRRSFMTFDERRELLRENILATERKIIKITKEEETQRWEPRQTIAPWLEVRCCCSACTLTRMSMISISYVFLLPWRFFYPTEGDGSRRSDSSSCQAVHVEGGAG